MRLSKRAASIKKTDAGHAQVGPKGGVHFTLPSAP